MTERPRSGLSAKLIRVVGVVVIVYAALALAVIEAFLVPFRLWGLPLPVSALLAVAGNVLLPWLMLKLTRPRGLALLPGAAWFLVILIASSPSTAGDLVVPQLWPGLVMLLAGAATITCVGYFVIAPRAGARPSGS